ncbi:probable palmitoyltransferase ZDHHC24 [Acanthaster planci]|uniref:Palmitoyltransferase n=1 Tax=Acanthaster planci TaxID=133434 RepID=A0A8B7XZR0_ACAPL|nr:probable palmitoyltransferase ZDHHC24 [Acanthaster planci]XP_022085242.1 probable palmitoyltransferase ZDHHC24 [Acanthaster planci]XP_022085243.1 probable palmitoyltransferase ZDHHC24 [Acanthaster planci]
MIPAIRWKQVLPPRLGDRLSVLVAITELWVAGLFELLVILPRKYPEATTSYWLSVALGLFLFVNTLGNLLMAMGTELSISSSLLPTVLKPGWDYCYLCQQNSPPRSYHCGHCGVCVLKRDHHCLFIGSCVGYANQRYYLICIMYISLGALYANYLNMEFVVENVSQNLHWTTLLASFTPMFGWVFGLFRPVSYFIAFQSGTCMLGFLAFTALFCYHAYIALRGQTTHEKRRIRDRSYDLGWRQNIRDVLGTRWYLVWIFPLITSPLPGDGVHFLKRGMVGLEEVKDL